MDTERQVRLHELLRRGLKLLETGEDLPIEWSREFFPSERREYELVYHGKETEEQILADTMAVPLQPASTFGRNGIEWHNKLIFGDNLQAMKTLLQMKERGELVNSDGTPGIRLIYIDPPFATKREFRGTLDQKAYQDKIGGARFIEFLRKRLVLLRELLSEDGFLVVHIDYRFGHYVKVVLDELLPQGFRNEIKIPRGTKNVQNQFDEITALTVGDDSLLLYAKSRGSKLPHLRVELDEHAHGKWDTFWRGTDRRTMRYKLFANMPTTGQWRWKESRALIAKANYELYAQKYAKKETLDEYYLRNLAADTELDFIRFNDEGVVQYYVPPRDSRIASTMWTDVRTIGRVTGYPTEKHEQLLFRLVDWLSHPDDLVLDAFAGSGTTCAVAEKLGRRWIGIDCGKLSIYTIQKRMLNLREDVANKGDHLSPKPFTLYNAGLYDFTKLKELPWESWRFFALQLFGCKDDPHKIRGFQLDGKRLGSSVLVFNHFDRGTISRDTVADIHASIGKQVGDKCFIIAPRGAFLFQEDYIEIDGTRYYALRIPYSFINELHARQFCALTQPSDESAINETVEAVGFDFIQAPEVEFSISSKGDAALLKIKKFESRARVRGQEQLGGFETFSMVMIDYQYDGEIFDLDECFYSHVLRNRKWTLEFPIKIVKGDAMFVFLDIYGNEARILMENGRLAKARAVKTRSHKTSKK